MRRLLVGVIVLALAIPAAAQEGPMIDHAQDAIIAFLDLTPDQVSDWGVLWEDHLAAEGPIVEAIAAVQAEIEALFEAGDPDPAELGLLVIERRDLGEELIAIHQVYVTGFEALLTEDQAGKLHAIRTADRIKAFIPAFKAFDLVRRR